MIKNNSLRSALTPFYTPLKIEILAGNRFVLLRMPSSLKTNFLLKLILLLQWSEAVFVKVPVCDGGFYPHHNHKHKISFPKKI